MARSFHAQIFGVLAASPRKIHRSTVRGRGETPSWVQSLNVHCPSSLS
uniref:Uncharacterized protein n=1 Tax=Anguilla anguilla TaxID=7936 RepID=A0A0E9QTW2_ANGAN